jgi:hypothetical protein
MSARVVLLPDVWHGNAKDRFNRHFQAMNLAAADVFVPVQDSWHPPAGQLALAYVSEGSGLVEPAL